MANSSSISSQMISYVQQQQMLGTTSVPTTGMMSSAFQSIMNGSGSLLGNTGGIDTFQSSTSGSTTEMDNPSFLAAVLSSLNPTQPTNNPYAAQSTGNSGLAQLFGSANLSALAPKEVSIPFNKMDINHDGVLDDKDFGKTVSKGKLGKLFQAFTGKTREFTDSMSSGTLITALDIDHNGKLDVKDFAQMSVPMSINGGKVSAKGLRQLMTGAVNAQAIAKKTGNIQKANTVINNAQQKSAETVKKEKLNEMLSHLSPQMQELVQEQLGIKQPTK